MYYADGQLHPSVEAIRRFATFQLRVDEDATAISRHLMECTTCREAGEAAGVYSPPTSEAEKTEKWRLDDDVDAARLRIRRHGEWAANATGGSIKPNRDWVAELVNDANRGAAVAPTPTAPTAPTTGDVLSEDELREIAGEARAWSAGATWKQGRHVARGYEAGVTAERKRARAELQHERQTADRIAAAGRNVVRRLDDMRALAERLASKLHDVRSGRLPAQPLYVDEEWRNTVIMLLDECRAAGLLGDKGKE